MSQDSTPYASSTSSRRDTEITSVVDFIKAIEEDVKDDPFAIDEATEVFYRGHADESWDLKPSIFRSHRGIENEHLLFRDMVAHVPRDFSECKSALDYLVQMQHYGLPTRLLDVTTNPLVALYFACQPAGDTSVSGIVNAAWDAGYGLAREAENYTPDDPDAYPSISNNDKLEEILSSVGVLAGVLTAASTNPEEDPVGDRMIDSIVTSLGEVFPDLEWLLKESADAGKKAAKEAGLKDGAVYLFSVPENRVKHYDSDTVSILSNLAKCGDIEINIHQDEKLATKLEQEEDVHMEHEDPSLKAFNNKDGIQKLLCQIREEKPYFQPLIDPFDLCRTFLVKAKYANPRIINQAGAFFLFGLKLTVAPWWKDLSKGKGKEVPMLPAQWVKRKLIVPKGCKADILKELELLGITDSYIYSGMEQYAKVLKERYEL
jgi:FRG domain protein